MKIKVKDLKRLIRESYAREIPSYVVDEIYISASKLDPKKSAKYCKEQLEHYFKMHINSTSSNPADMRMKIIKMHNVLSNMEEEIRELKNFKEELKEVIDQSIRRFLFI